MKLKIGKPMPSFDFGEGSPFVGQVYWAADGVHVRVRFCTYGEVRLQEDALPADEGALYDVFLRAADQARRAAEEEARKHLPGVTR